MNNHWLRWADDTFSRDTRLMLACYGISTFRENRKEIETLLSRFPNATFLSLNYFLTRELENAQTQHVSIHEFQQAKNYAGRLQDAERLATTWYKDPKTQEDLSIVDGVSLGCAFELSMKAWMQAVLTAWVDSQKFFERSQVEGMIFLEGTAEEKKRFYPGSEADPYQTFFRHHCGRLNIPFVPAKAKAGLWNFASDFRKAMRWSPPVPLGQFSVRLPMALYTVLKNGFLLLRNVRLAAGSSNAKRRVLLASAATANYLGKNLVRRMTEQGAFGLDVWDGESREGPVRNVLSSFCPDIFLAPFSSRPTILERNRKSWQETLSRSTRYEGLVLSELFPGLFENIRCVRFPQMEMRARALKRWIRKSRPGAIIAHTGLAEQERLVLLAGNRFGVPTVVFQHGIEMQIENSDFGYPCVESRHWIWGPAYREFKELKCGPRCKVEVVGCHLHVDESFEGPANGAFPRQTDPGTILLILHPSNHFNLDGRFSFDENEALVELCLEAIREFPSKTLIVKPRVFDPQIDRYREMIENSGVANAKINAGSIVPLLKECDLYMHASSTAALEGLMFGKPGLQFLYPFQKHADMGFQGMIPAPFVPLRANLGVESPDCRNLIEGIEQIYECAQTREELSRGRQRFLQEFANGNSRAASDLFVQCLGKVVPV